MLIKLVRLLRRIQPTRREPGRFFIALRGGPLAPATIGWRTLPVRISLTDQPGEFCDGILSSVGSEIVVSHRTYSDSVFKPSPDTHALSTSRASFKYRSWWIMNRKSLKQPASIQDRTDQPIGSR